MAALDDIIEQSFQDEINRFNNKKVKSGEKNNVAELFKQVQVIKTECNICYNEAANCIQCYQCDFKYCAECLIKVISEFNKCSACQANFKDNYDQLKTKNKKTASNKNNNNTHNNTHNNIHNNAQPKLSANINKNISNSNYNNNLMNDLMSDYEIEQLTLLLQMDNIQIKPNAKCYAKSKVNKNKYLDNDFDDEIEACQFQTVGANPNSKSSYSFNVQHNTDSYELIYTCNDYNLLPIRLNYKLLDKYFQRTVFICLAEIIYKPNIFPNIWQTISSMITDFTCNYIHLIYNKNEKNKNQAFLYQKQDLINTINQMASYN